MLYGRCARSTWFIAELSTLRLRIEPSFSFHSFSHPPNQSPPTGDQYVFELGDAAEYDFISMVNKKLTSRRYGEEGSGQFSYPTSS